MPNQPAATDVPLGSKHQIPTGVFILLWLLPIAYTGFTERSVPLLPASITRLHWIACLFPQATHGCDVYFVQVYRRGDLDWTTVPIDKLAPMELFGRRLRLEEILMEAGPNDRDELALWVVRRMRFLPDQPQSPEAVRFLRSRIPLQSLAAQAGPWARPHLADLPDEWVRVVSTHLVRWD